MAMTSKANRRGMALVGTIVLLFGSVAPAAAEQQRRRKPVPAPAVPTSPPAPEPPAGPWAEGVTEAQKAQAQDRLDAGNALFLEKKFDLALERYQEALAAWDHPAIRFNVVRCLINLGRSLEAFENLEKALTYGAAPLEDAVYQEALGYQRLLEGQITTLEVSCKQAGPALTLDGQDLMTCPGSQRRRLLAGRHQVVGTKKDFITLTRNLELAAGKVERLEVVMLSLADATTTERRWTAWKPWAVFGGGAVVVALGGLLQLKAAGDMNRFDDEITALCGTTGCADGEVPAATADLESRAHLENNLAVGMMIGGGVVAIGGLVAVYLNRPHTVLPDTDAGISAASHTSSLTPFIGPSTVGLSLTF